jgi:hypothetical protein
MTVEVIELCFVYRVYAFDALSPNKMRTRAFDLAKRSMDLSSQYLRRVDGICGRGCTTSFSVRFKRGGNTSKCSRLELSRTCR